MAPALKVKRLKKSAKPSSTAVVNDKPKWEKPRKSISSQSGVAKIKNVNKRSFDPIKANRGVVLLKNIPHGFYEEEMRKYFGQFGLVTRVRLARSQRTGRSKGFAYIEFRVPEVAEIAAETMNNYIMFKHRLTSVYIPPEKQTHNFFRRDVTFTTDSNGETSFSSDKIRSIDEAIGSINRELTDEEHAKRMKRDQKALQKQQKKYGVDLSNILVAGNSSSSDASPPTPEVKAKESKKKATLAKKAATAAEKKPKTKLDGNKIAPKKDKKKASNSVSSNGGESLLQGLLDETYDTDTSDDDFKIDHSFNAAEDSDDSSGAAPGLVRLLAKNLSKNNKRLQASESEEDDDDESDSDIETDDDLDSDDDDFEINDESEDDGKLDDDGESDDDEDVESDDDDGWEDDAESDDGGNFMEIDDESEVDDDESEDDQPETLHLTSKDKKKLLKGATSNGAVDVKANTNLKRKLKEELDTVAKKKKQNTNKKQDVPSILKASIPVPEPSKVVINKKKQKPNRSEKILSTSSSEPESLPPQTKHKKAKLASPVQITSKLSSAPDAGKQKMNKKKAKNLSAESTFSSSIADTTSSEPEDTKQKLNKKKSKLNTVSVSKPTTVQVNIEKPEGFQLKTEKKKNQPAKDGQKNFNQKSAPPATSIDLGVPKPNKKNQPVKKEKVSPKTAAPKPAEPEIQKSKKKNQPAKGEQTIFNPKTSASTVVEPAVQKSKKKNQSPKDEPTNFSPKTAASTSAKPEAQKPKNNPITVANGESTVAKPEPVKIDKKKKKVKPVTSSLISENGLGKKSVKATIKGTQNKSPEKSKKSSAWVTASETEGEEVKKPKAKAVNANLKTIVHKNNSKKKNDNVKPLDAKKIKQTPDELLRFIAAKDLKQKSKKKSK